MNRMKKLKTALLAGILCLSMVFPGTALAAASESKTAGKTVAAASSVAENAKGRWLRQNGRYWYRNANGSYTKNNFQKIGNYWYFFDQNGWLVTGWIKKSNSWFYLKPTGGAGTMGRVMTGWQTINGATYYLRTTGTKGQLGRMATGWKTLGEKDFYFKSSGAMATGWQSIGKYKFYFAQSGAYGVKGKLLTGWRTLGGNKYYLRPNGSLGIKGSRVEKSWKTIDGKACYFDSNGIYVPKNMSQSEFIAFVGPLATKDMKASGILASVTTAQAILESGYGSTTLAVDAHNLFGMKASLSGNTWASKWKGDIYKKKTIEYDKNNRPYTIIAEFRKYDNYAESLADHSAYLRGAKNGSALRYQGIIGNKDYEATIKIIKKGGYATDPLYVNKLCDIIERFKLTKYDK